MLGIIGGTGFDSWEHFQFSYDKTIDTPYGRPSAKLIFGKINNLECVLLSRHGQPHRIPPHKINYRANIWALYQVGVRNIIAMAAVGGIDENLHQPCLIIPHDILDYTWGREHTFSDGKGELQHIDFTWPYDENLRQRLINAAKKANVPFTPEGVYAVTQGPRLETAAEIQKLHHDGATIVGMTGMPEAALARELGMQYACLAMSVNAAAGTVQELISMQQIMQSLDTNKGYVYALLECFSVES